ncbi:MAG: RNA polymerase sigma-70 factor (ECF subfamily) [Myxococcota bacterium]|jgi:RNA polymerase sigma-70 factor (ECF subfamily)
MGSNYETAAPGEDARLVKEILAGNDAAFVELHERYERRIYFFALKRMSDPSDAEDVTQEVFLQVFRGLVKFEGRSSLLTWMFGIAHNQICRRFRRRRPMVTSLDNNEVNALASDETPADQRTDFVRILRNCSRVLEEKVPEQQREAFELRYIENRSTRDIAKEMGKSQQAVKISLFRTRKTLYDNNRKLPSILSA